MTDPADQRQQPPHFSLLRPAAVEGEPHAVLQSGRASRATSPPPRSARPEPVGRRRTAAGTRSRAVRGRGAPPSRAAAARSTCGRTPAVQIELRVSIRASSRARTASRLGRRDPGCGNPGAADQALGAAPLRMRSPPGSRDPCRPARPVRPERCVSAASLAGRSAWITSSSRGQVEPARGEVGRDADPRPPVAHRRHRRRCAPSAASHRTAPTTLKPRLPSLAGQMRRRLALAAEDDGALRLVQPQDVDDGALAVVRARPPSPRSGCRRAPPGAVASTRIGIGLEPRGQRLDPGGDGRGEHQRLALRSGGVEEELEVVAKAHVEHVVGLVEHDATRAPRRRARRARGDRATAPASRPRSRSRPPAARARCAVHAAGAAEHPRARRRRRARRARRAPAAPARASG